MKRINLYRAPDPTPARCGLPLAAAGWAVAFLGLGSIVTASMHVNALASLCEAAHVEEPGTLADAADPLETDIAECQAQMQNIQQFGDLVDHARLLAMLTHATPGPVSFHKLSISSLGGESADADVEVQLLGQTGEGDQVVTMLKRLNGYQGLSRPQLKDFQRVQALDSARRFEIRFDVDPQAVSSDKQPAEGQR